MSGSSIVVVANALRLKGRQRVAMGAAAGEPVSAVAVLEAAE
jgi:hypothetical protein